MHEGHKDTVKHFGNLKKGIAGFAELKDILQQDPSKIADPTVRAQAEAQVRTALNGAKKDIDKVFADVIETIGTVLVLVEFVLLMVNLTRSPWHSWSVTPDSRRPRTASGPVWRESAGTSTGSTRAWPRWAAPSTT